ncbi:MAG: CehA/McbA family metallohydrolase [Chthoniobacterales bacterium]
MDSIRKQQILEHSYADLSGGVWLRGNLHSHSTRSDGAETAEVVIRNYRDRNYDFLMLSDHDVFSSKEWLEGFDPGEMILIPGNEISQNGNHILHVNANTHVQPDPERQTVFNEVAQDAESFAIVCHPNWKNDFNHTSISQLLEWKGYSGIEVYNGVIGRLDGSPYATDKWDMLLSKGLRSWGYANDDSHRQEDTELGWNVVHVKDRSRAAIVEALREGRFYGSSGVVISAITVDGTRIRIETQNAERIAAVRDVGLRFAQVDDRCIEVEVPEGAKYVRFECWGRGEQMAWTQPFYVRNAES